MLLPLQDAVAAVVEWAQVVETSVDLRHNAPSRRRSMARERGWWFLGIGIFIAVTNLLEIRNLWSVFSLFDWFLIGGAMIAPPVLLKRYLTVAQGSDEQVANVATGIALGGY